MDDAFAPQHAHGPSNLLQEQPNGVLSQGALCYGGERERDQQKDPERKENEGGRERRGREGRSF